MTIHTDGTLAPAAAAPRVLFFEEGQSRAVLLAGAGDYKLIHREIEKGCAPADEGADADAYYPASSDAEQFYDLSVDDTEQTNLLNDAGYAAQVSQLRNYLLCHLAATAVGAEPSFKSCAPQPPSPPLSSPSSPSPPSQSPPPRSSPAPTSPPACADEEGEDCREPRCERYPDRKKEKCQKTCGLCEPPPSTLPPPPPPPSPSPLPPPLPSPPPPPSPSPPSPLPPPLPSPSPQACADKEGETCKKKLCDKYALKKKRKCKKTCDECEPRAPPPPPGSRPPPPPKADCADLADKGCKMTPGLVKKCKKKPKSMKKCNKKCKQDARKKLCEKTCCELKA